MTKTLSKTEIATIFAKGLVGSAPFVGALASEIVGAVIPNQRIERIESFLEKLEQKIEETDKAKIEEKIKTPESVDLLEDAFIQSSRALSEERKDYIASLLKNSLTNDELDYIEYKRIFTLFGDLNDLEVLILKSQLLTMSDSTEAKDFWEKHSEILEAPLVFDSDTQEEMDKGTLFKTHTTHLVNLGLMKPKFNHTEWEKNPIIDSETGMFKASGYNITSLGILLLKTIDQEIY